MDKVKNIEYLVKIKKNVHKIFIYKEFFQELISNHEKTIKEGETRDLIDAYLHEIKEKADETNFNSK